MPTIVTGAPSQQDEMLRQRAQQDFAYAQLAQQRRAQQQQSMMQGIGQFGDAFGQISQQRSRAEQQQARADTMMQLEGARQAERKDLYSLDRFGVPYDQAREMFELGDASEVELLEAATPQEKQAIAKLEQGMNFLRTSGEYTPEESELMVAEAESKRTTVLDGIRRRWRVQKPPTAQEKYDQSRIRTSSGTGHMETTSKGFKVIYDDPPSLDFQMQQLLQADPAQLSPAQQEVRRLMEIGDEAGAWQSLLEQDFYKNNIKIDGQWRGRDPKGDWDTDRGSAAADPIIEQGPLAGMTESEANKEIEQERKKALAEGEIIANEQAIARIAERRAAIGRSQLPPEPPPPAFHMTGQPSTQTPHWSDSSQHIPAPAVDSADVTQARQILDEAQRMKQAGKEIPLEYRERVQWAAEILRKNLGQ